SSLISTERPPLPGHNRVVLPSSSLGLLILRQSFGAVELYWLPMVWAFAHEAANVASKTTANASVTRICVRRMQAGEGSLVLPRAPDIGAESYYKSASPSAHCCQCVSSSLGHALDFPEKTLSHRPFPHRARPLRHQTDQERHPDHPLFRAAA